MVRLRPQLALLASLPLLLACDSSPTEPAMVPGDPLHVALAARIEALSAPGVDPGRRDAETPMFEALIHLFERADAAEGVTE